MTRRHVGTAIAESLAAHGTSRAFLVPGESFLPVLDGLYNSPVEAIVSRQEGGASYMAEAYGKATGEPGVAMVTRGPGASNAFVGVHTGWQDGTPMVIFVGLIPFSDRDRESFQEFDPKAWFGTQAKQVFVLDDPTRASRVVAEAFFQAKQGRPGPVIVGLPEDVLYQDFEGEIEAPIPVTEGAVSAADAAYVSEKLAAAKKPLIFAGGGRWTPESARAIEKFAEINQIPVVHDFRASDRISFSSPANAGWLGYGRNEHAAELLSEADVLLEVGALLTDVPSDGYTLRQDPHAENIVVNIDTGLRGHSGAISRHILASPLPWRKPSTTSTPERYLQRNPSGLKTLVALTRSSPPFQVSRTGEQPLQAPRIWKQSLRRCKTNSRKRPFLPLVQATTAFGHNNFCPPSTTLLN